MGLLPADPAYGVIESLLFHRIPRDGSDAWFRMGGVVHLYTASGIHLLACLSILESAALAAGAGGRTRARVLRVLLWSAFAALILLAWRWEGYAFSLFRPLLSILLRRWLAWSGRRVGVFAPLIAVLLVESMFSCFRGWSPGAIHYYGAVGGGLVALLRRNAAESGMRLHFRMAVYSWIPLAVLDLLRDRFVSPWTPLLSFLTIPPIAFVLFPLSLLSLGLTGEVHPSIRELWAGFLSTLVRLMEALPLVWSVSGLSIGAGAIFAFFFGRFRRDFRVLALLPLLLFLRFAGIESAPNRVVQLNVGQGDSALIQQEGLSELIDVGSSWSQKPDAWVRRASRYGAPEISGVLLSHLDEDHSGGLRALMSALPVGCIEMSAVHRASPTGRRLVRDLRERFPSTPILDSGCLRLSKVGWFESRRSGAAGNRWMAGIFHNLGRGWGYFAQGDGDQEQEALYLKHFRREISRTGKRIWKVGHHGSRHSSASGFLEKIRARELWISSGLKNRYDHPAAETLARLFAVGGRIRRTDQEGDLDSAALTE